MSALLRFKYVSKVFLTTLICVISLQYLTVYAEALPNHKELPSESFRAMLDENPEVELLMRESIGIAARINPDRETNPVQSLDEIYDFIDYSVTCMPWNIMPEDRYDSFATKCDQSILYIYWLMDQPLTALEIIWILRILGNRSIMNCCCRIPHGT